MVKKTALVTGSRRGIGLGIARKLGQEGYQIIVSATKEQDDAVIAALRSEGIDCEYIPCNIANAQDRARIFEDIRAQGYLLDCLVMNAANLGIAQDTLTVDIEDFMNVVHTNIGWNFMLARQAALQMKEKGGGSIVFINSNTAYRAIPSRAAYSCSKGGVLSLSRALAIDLGKYNIRSNCVLPGMIKTERWKTNYNDCKNALSNYTPLRDIAEFEDIANAAWYFGSDESRNTTGAELVVDGGNMAQLTPELYEREQK